MFAVVIAILMALVWYSANRYERLVNPVTVFAAPNLLSLALLLGSGWLFNDLSIETYGLLFFALFSYLTGVLLGGQIVLSRKTNGLAEVSRTKIRRCIVAMSVVFDIFATMYLVQMSSRYGLLGMFSNLSAVNIDQQNGELNGVFSYFLPLAFPLSLLILAATKGGFVTRCKAAYAIQFGVCFLPYLFSARRSMLFTLVVANLLCYMLLGRSEMRRFNGKILFRGLLGACIVIAAIWFMGFTQSLMNKSIDSSGLMFLGMQIPGILADAFEYVAGSYSYFDLYGDPDHLLAGSKAPMIASARMLYLYIAPMIEIPIDATAPFAHALLPIGVGQAHYFNTEPMLYYLLLDFGPLYFIGYFVWGFVAEKAYLSIIKEGSVPSVGMSIAVMSVLFWSFRSYDMIFLSTWLWILFSLCVFVYLRSPGK